MSREVLIAEAAECGLTLNVTQAGKLFDYLNFLNQWNTVVNLTGIRKPREQRHLILLDSLMMLEHLPSGACLDVGSGGGILGIPLAIMRPELSFTLLDSRSKKTRFLEQCVHHLGLLNVNVVTQRIEDYSPKGLFHGIISRAFRLIGDFVAGSQHLALPGACFMTLKKQPVTEECAQIKRPFVVQLLQTYALPGQRADRVLVKLGLEGASCQKS